MSKIHVLPQITIVIENDLVCYRYKGGKKIYVEHSEWKKMCADSIAEIVKLEIKKRGQSEIN